MKKIISIIIGSILCVAIIITVGVVNSNKNNVTEKEEVHVSGVMAVKTESELILDSDLIICGNVSDILDSKWSNEDFVRGNEISNVLQTDIVINVDDVLSGSLEDDTVTVRIDKGEDEKTIVY